jgi:hypothetical protein
LLPYDNLNFTTSAPNEIRPPHEDFLTQREDKALPSYHVFKCILIITLMIYTMLGNGISHLEPYLISFYFSLV